MPEHVTRRTALTAVAATLAGCAGGGDDTPTPTPATASTPSGNPAVGDVTQMGDLRLTSPAFENVGQTSPATPSSANSRSPAVSETSRPTKSGTRNGMPGETQTSSSVDSISSPSRMSSGLVP